MQAQPTMKADMKTTQANSRPKILGGNPMLLTLALILIPSITGVAGQLLLKIGMTQMGALDISVAAIPMLLWKIITSPAVVIGLTIYVGGLFFWLLALNRADLSFVYPFASLSYVLTTLAAWGILHENIPSLRWAGLLVICAGVVMVARS